MIDWRIDAVNFSNCNCDSNCPCQFELYPTQGNCRGFEVGRIERGHFGNVRLDGLCWAVTYAWPGAVYEGNGAMQAIIDQSADELQRKALSTILHGGETEEARTHWWVFHAMSGTVHEPIFRTIDVEIDIDQRRARASIPGLLEFDRTPDYQPSDGRGTSRPNRHPARHRVRDR